MKLPLSILATALSVSFPAAHAGETGCIEPNRYNLESVCRAECEKAYVMVAFSVSYGKENGDICHCYEHVFGLGSYTGSGDGESDRTCYSMEPGKKSKVLSYGDCVLDSTDGGYGTMHELRKCEAGEDETQNECLDKNKSNLQNVCRNECEHIESVAFAISYADDDDLCRCYGDMDGTTYVGSSEDGARLTCYSMASEKMEVIGSGDCIPEHLNGPRLAKHTMRSCEEQQQQQPHVEKLLRGSVSV